MTELETDDEDYLDSLHFFKISLQLTKKGFENYKEVIRIVFEYINMMKSKGLQDHNFDETQNAGKLSWKYI